MTARERTAYPQFKRSMTAEEISDSFSLADSEISFVLESAKGQKQRLTLAVLLKSFQALGYLPKIQDVPQPIVSHIANYFEIEPDQPLSSIAHRSRVRYRQTIHSFLKVRPYGKGGQSVIESVIRKTALTMSDPADLINVAIEQLVLNRYELPGFTTLDEFVNHIRYQTHLDLYDQVTARLTDEEVKRIDALLERKPFETRYPVTKLKALPRSASLNMMVEWEEHLTWLESILDPSVHISVLAHTKMAQFASEAYQPEVSDLLRIRTVNRRRTLLLCLLHQMQVRTRDQLVEMFQKRISSMHKSGKNRLKALREAYRSMSEEVTDTFSQIVDVAAETETQSNEVQNQADQDAKLGKQVRTILTKGGGIEYFQNSYQLLSALHDNNYFPLMQNW